VSQWMAEREAKLAAGAGQPPPQQSQLPQLGGFPMTQAQPVPQRQTGGLIPNWAQNMLGQQAPQAGGPMGIPGGQGFGRLDPDQQNAMIGQMSPEQQQAYGAALGAGIPEVTMPPQQPSQPRQPWQQGPYYDGMADLEQETGMPMGQAGPRQVPPMGRAEKEYERGMMQSPYGGGGGNYVPPPQMPVPGYSDAGAELGRREVAAAKSGGSSFQLPPEAMEDQFNAEQNARLQAEGFPIGQGPGGPMRMIDDGQGGQTVMPRVGTTLHGNTYDRPGLKWQQMENELAAKEGRAANPEIGTQRDLFNGIQQRNTVSRMFDAQVANEALRARPQKAREQRSAAAAKAKEMRQVRLGKIPPTEEMLQGIRQQMALQGNRPALQLLGQQAGFKNAADLVDKQGEWGLKAAGAEADAVLAREKAKLSIEEGSTQGQANKMALGAQQEAKAGDRNAQRVTIKKELGEEKTAGAFKYLSKFEGPELIEEANQLGLTPEKVHEMLRAKMQMGAMEAGQQLLGRFARSGTQGQLDASRRAQHGSMFVRSTYEQEDERAGLQDLLDRLSQAHNSKPGR